MHRLPEPKDPADPRAVTVFTTDGMQLGYLTTERCGTIGAKLGAGEPYVAIFQKAHRCATIIRVRFGQGRPPLPAPRQPTANDDLYPDQEGPE